MQKVIDKEIEIHNIQASRRKLVVISKMKVQKSTAKEMKKMSAKVCASCKLNTTATDSFSLTQI